MEIEGGFDVDEWWRDAVGKNEIEVAAFENALRRAEEENFIANDGATEVGGGIPAEKKGSARCSIGNVVGVEFVVAVKNRGAAVPVVCSAASHDVYHTTRCVAELCFVTSGDNLEFHDGVLVELCRGTTVEV